MADSRREAGDMTARKPLPDAAHGAVNDSADAILDEINRLRKIAPTLESREQAIIWQTIANLTNVMRRLEAIGADTRP